MRGLGTLGRQAVSWTVPMRLIGFRNKGPFSSPWFHGTHGPVRYPKKLPWTLNLNNPPHVGKVPRLSLV